MNFHMQVTPKALTWLGSAFEKKTKISPFTNCVEPGFEEADKAVLVEQGILDEQSAFTPVAYAMLKTLAEADCYAGFRVTGTFGVIDKVVYFSGDNKVYLDNAGDTFTLSESTDVDVMAGLLNEITGISHLVNATLNVQLDCASARVLTALVDLTRQGALVHCSETGHMPAGFTTEAIEKACGLTGTRWLGAYLKGLRLPNSVLDISAVEQSLKALEEAGLVGRNPAGCFLTRDAYDFAVNFLIIEHAIHTRVGKLEGEEIRFGEALFLQAGLHDTLMLDSDGKSIEFSSISTSAMVEYLQHMLIQKPDM